MKSWFVVDLEGKLDDGARSEPVVDPDLVLLPPNRHVDRSGIRGQVQGRRVDAAEVHITVAINKLQILEVTIRQVARAVSDLGIDSLTANIVKAKRPGLLIHLAVFKTHVPVPLVVVEVHGEERDRILEAYDIIGAAHEGDAPSQPVFGPPQ